MAVRLSRGAPLLMLLLPLHCDSADQTSLASASASGSRSSPLTAADAPHTDGGAGGSRDALAAEGIDTTVGAAMAAPIADEGAIGGVGGGSSATAASAKDALGSADGDAGDARPDASGPGGAASTGDAGGDRDAGAPPFGPTPCGSLTCDGSREICLACSCGGPTSFSCEPVPTGCAADRSCGCVADSICSGDRTGSCSSLAANTILCDTGAD